LNLSQFPRTDFKMQKRPILVVEDDPVIAGVICRGLMDMGHDTHHADNGIGAIRRCLQGDIGAMVLDRMLPDISGIDVPDPVAPIGPYAAGADAVGPWVGAGSH
jgi:CheY-like chemotaxis protein